MERRKRTRTSRVWSHWYWLLFVTYVAVLWVPFYNRVDPVILGFPFFYAYQMIWVVVSAILTGIVFFATRRSSRNS